MKLIVLFGAFVFLNISQLPAAISGPDLSYQKEVMDTFAQQGIVLLVGTHHPLEYWKSISHSRETLLPIVQGKVNVITFLPGEFKDFRFFVTKFHKGNQPVDPQIVEMRIEDVVRPE